MVVLVACGNQKINEHYSVKIVGEGIEPHKADNKQELFDVLENKKIDVLILDIESEEYDGIQTIKEIKTHHNQTLIIILTYKTGMDFAKQMMEIGVHGFVSKTEDFDSQINKVISLLDSLKTRRKEKRKYMRINPDNTQTNRFTLTIPGLDKEYYGKIKDISLGGIAATMSTNIHDALLYAGLKIEVTFTLNKVSANSSAKVVAKRGTDVAVSFRNMSSTTRKKLSEYIISRIK
jgi:YesN/AraC family two-component response regulator